MSLPTRLVAYSPGTDDRLGFLPAPMSWDASAVVSGDGAMTLRYSLLAEGGAIAARSLEAGFDVGVETWLEHDGGGWQGTTGWHERGPRYLMVGRKDNSTDLSQVAELTLTGYSWLLGKVRNLNTAALEGKKSKHAGQRKISNPSAGKIMATFLSEHAARSGPSLPLLHSTWTATHDSSGRAWPVKSQPMYYDLGTSLRDILDALVTAKMVTSWIVVGRELMLFNKNGTEPGPAVEHGSVPDSPGIGFIAVTDIVLTSATSAKISWTYTYNYAGGPSGPNIAATFRQGMLADGTVVNGLAQVGSGFGDGAGWVEFSWSASAGYVKVGTGGSYGGAARWQTVWLTLPTGTLTTTSPVVLAPGDDLIDAPSEQSIADRVSRLLVVGDGKKHVTERDPDVSEPYGRWEGYLDDSGKDDADDLEDDGQALLDDTNRPLVQLTYGVSPTSRWSPWEYYDLRDTVIAPDQTGAMTSLPVQQITLGQDEDGTPTAAIVLGDRITHRDIRNASKLRQVAGGASTIAGAGVVSAATGFTAASLASLSDTALDDITDGQAIAYNAADDEFVPISVLADESVDLVGTFEGGLV